MQFRTQPQPTHHWRYRPVVLIGLLLILLTACGQGDYLATFETTGDWSNEARPDVTGGVDNGRYVLSVDKRVGPTTYWAAANESFGDGVYEVEATQIDGELNSGFGLLLRVDNETGSFYFFEISADGYVWIGRCTNGCTESQPLLGDGWVRNGAVLTGLNVTNRLRVVAAATGFIFYVNDIEVGRIFDASLIAGDIGLAVETLGGGGATVAFDNVRYTPASE